MPTASAALRGIRGYSNSSARNVVEALVRDKGNPVPALAGIYHQVAYGRPIKQTLPRTFGERRAAITAQNLAHESTLRRLESYYPTLDFRSQTRIVPNNRYHSLGGTKGSAGQLYLSTEMKNLGIDGELLISRNSGSFVYPPSQIITVTAHEGSHLRAAAGNRASNRDRFYQLANIPNSRNTFYGPETNNLLKTASNKNRGYYRDPDELLAFTNQNIYPYVTPSRLQDPTIRSNAFQNAINKLPKDFKLNTPERKQG